MPVPNPANRPLTRTPFGRVGLKRLLRPLLLGAVLCVAGASGWAAWLQSSGNFHPVIAGELYRSAQPDALKLQDWSKAHGLRSVINLRGASDAAWYDTEVATARRLGLTHADFAMKDSEQLDPARAAELVALIASLPKPVLIHCKAGADRTGLAAALYLAAQGAREHLAEGQLSFRFGHVGLPVSAAWAMDQSWEAAEPMFGFES
ncbi:tyrosine-protein phosphatase [Paracoccus sp. PAR01]|nr:tyrosine-protein phosphatase [Paracoccus sp. PAR01]